MLKRIADWLEKVSVAALAVGLFQGHLVWGLTLAAASLLGSLLLTKKLGGPGNGFDDDNLAWNTHICPGGILLWPLLGP
jgi:hypothetical protein